jgi:hypothetical protein
VALTTDLSALEVDLSIASTYAVGPPHQVCDVLREHAPVKWQPAGEGTTTGGFWSLARFDDIAGVSRSKEAFTNQRGNTFPIVDRSTATTSFLRTGPPVHTRLRRVASESFTPRVVSRYETWVRDIVDETLDRIEPLDVLDFLSVVASFIPALVIAEVLGVPRQRRVDVVNLTDALFAAVSSQLQDKGAYARAAAPFFEFAFEMREMKRRRPGEDVVPELVNSPEQLTDDEYKDYFMTLVTAGF